MQLVISLPPVPSAAYRLEFSPVSTADKAFHEPRPLVPPFTPHLCHDQHLVSQEADSFFWE